MSFNNSVTNFFRLMIWCLIGGLIFYVASFIWGEIGLNKEAHAIFDIRSLKGKNSKEINKVLGKPKTGYNPFEQTMPADSIPWNQYYYQRDGAELTVRFNPRTLKVIGFYIESEVGYSDIKDLLKLGNLDSTDMKDFLYLEDRERSTNLHYSIAISPIGTRLTDMNW
jgi:hypothetical protein